jgi:hypothetical protein
LAIRRRKLITKEDYDKYKSLIVEGKTVIFKYKLSSGKTKTFNSETEGKGFSDSSSSDNSSSDESSSEDHAIKYKMDLSHFIITPKDFRSMTGQELEHKYNNIKEFIKAYNGTDIPSLPNIDGLSKVKQKKTIQESVQSIFQSHPQIMDILNGEETDSEDEKEGKGMSGYTTIAPLSGARRPDYSKMLRHEKELSAGLTIGRGFPKKQLETFHIDINSHNVRDGKYAMGDGIISRLRGGALDDEDIVRLESLMEHMHGRFKQAPSKNILEGIKQEDITKLMKTMEASKTAQAGSKESLETARKALRERLARESKKPKRKTITESLKTQKDKDIEAYNKAYASKQVKHFTKGSVSAAEYMAHLRSLRKKK